MSTEIKDTFIDKFPLNITPAICKAIVNYVASYEIKSNNVKAFNSPLLGVNTAVFTAADRDGLFDLLNLDGAKIATAVTNQVTSRSAFGVTENAFKKLVTSVDDAFIKEHAVNGINVSEIRKIVSKISSINASFKVVSDPFNIFITYLLYSIMSSTVNAGLKHDAAKAAIMLLQYKFYTSMVNYRFKYKADEAMMTAFYENLSMKYAIREYGTWRDLLLARAESMLSGDSIHANTLINYEPDDKVLYLITDIQTRLRNQINTFTEEYMKFKDTEDKMRTYSHVGSDPEGNKNLIGDTRTLDGVVSNVYNDAMSVNRLLDEKAQRLCVGLFTSINANIFKNLLVKFSDYISTMTKQNKIDDYKKYNGNMVVVGSYALIETIIQKSLRYCVISGVDMTRPTDALKKIKDAYSSSRISDEGINLVRNSIDKFVLETKLSVRETTNVSLRIALILYLIIISFRYM